MTPLISAEFAKASELMTLTLFFFILSLSRSNVIYKPDYRQQTGYTNK